MVDEESLSCLTTLTCSQVSHFATTPDWRMELISAGLNACLFHLALTRGGGGVSLLREAELYRGGVRGKYREIKEGDKIIR